MSTNTFIAVPVYTGVKSVVLMVKTHVGTADVLIAGSPAGTAAVNVATGEVSFSETATERLQKAGLAPAAVALAAREAVWVEARAHEALNAAAPLALASAAQAWAAMNAVAMQYAHLATNGSPEEQASALRVRDRVIELAQRFK